MSTSTSQYCRAPIVGAEYPFSTGAKYPFPQAAKLRAVSVRQPWAWLLASGWKDIENRVWRPSFDNGPVWLAVHAGKRVEDGLQTFFECDLGVEIPITTSAILGAILVDAYVEGADGSTSPWYAGVSGWTVKAAVLLREPIEDVTGALGCFRMPDHITTVLEQRWADAEHRTWRTTPE